MGVITSKISSSGAGSDQSKEHCSCCHCRQRADQLLGASQQSHLIPSAPSKTSERTGPSFLDLPIELRLMIYEELLVVGKVFFANETQECRNNARYKDANRYARPALAILRVCRSIYDEAEPIYLSKNLFVLPLRWHHMEPFHSKVITGTYDPKATHLMSRNASQYLKNISIAIDQSDLTAFKRPNHDYWKDKKQYFRDMSDDPILRIKHEDMIDELAAPSSDCCTGFTWTYISTSLERFFEGSDRNRLEYVDIDYSNAFCPWGCWRPLWIFDMDWIATIRPANIGIIGCWEGEDEDILEDIAFWCEDSVTRDPHSLFGSAVILHFRSEDDRDPWAHWIH